MNAQIGRVISANAAFDRHGTRFQARRVGQNARDNSITRVDTHQKRAYNDDISRPKFALMDPELTKTLPDYQTESGCADIMMHTMERYFTNTPDVEVTDRMLEGILLAMLHEGRRVMEDPHNYEARANIMWAGMVCHNDIMGVGRQQDWNSHHLEHVLSAKYDCAHGAGLAVIMPAWMRYCAEHGGGNNSTFTTHVVTSSGTDTYSAIAAALGSLKGPKHGGANIKVVKMFDDMKEHISDYGDEDAVKDYLKRLLHKEAFDNAGLIYGMGHAVYSLSDPRANIFKAFVESLSKEKGREDEFRLYSMVERLAPQVIAEERKIYKGVSANVDFYSGFVYSMLDLPPALYTPIFAIARISGWSAHRLEEVAHSGKIMRPAYKNVGERKAYVPMEER